MDIFTFLIYMLLALIVGVIGDSLWWWIPFLIGLIIGVIYLIIWFIFLVLYVIEE